MRSASGETSVGSTPGGTFCLEVRALSLTEVRSWVPQATAAATKASGNARIDDRKDTRHAPFVGISDLLYAIATRLEQVSAGAIQLNMGTLYPGLMRLEQRGAIRGSSRRCDIGESIDGSFAESPAGNTHQCCHDEGSDRIRPCQPIIHTGKANQHRQR